MAHFSGRTAMRAAGACPVFAAVWAGIGNKCLVAGEIAVILNDVSVIQKAVVSKINPVFRADDNSPDIIFNASVRVRAGLRRPALYCYVHNVIGFIGFIDFAKGVNLYCYVVSASSCRAAPPAKIFCVKGKPGGIEIIN
jgi:hypothetical protein